MFKKASETVNYTWTDENGVTHFSDTPPPGTAPIQEEETPQPSPLPTLRERIKQSVRSAINSSILLAYRVKASKNAFIAGAVTVLVGIGGLVVGLKLHKRNANNKRLRELARQNEQAIKTAIQNFKYFRSSLSRDIDRQAYYAKLNGIRASLTSLKEASPRLEESHGSVIACMDKALESYVDCSVLWNVNSHEGLSWADRNGYLMKYPALLPIMGKAADLRPGSISVHVRGAVLRYASNYIDRAEARFRHFPPHRTGAVES